MVRRRQSARQTPLGTALVGLLGGIALVSAVTSGFGWARAAADRDAALDRAAAEQERVEGLLERLGTIEADAASARADSKIALNYLRAMMGTKKGD